MIASVSGSRIWAVVPAPSSEVSSTSPPSSRTVARTASMPTPRPEMSLVTSAVEKPGWNSSSAARPGVDGVDRVGGDQPALGGLAGDLGGVDPGAVVAHRDDHVAAGVAGGDLERAGRGLAGGDALVRRLEAVVERVADEVHERVAERVDDRAVELGLLADELELDLLAELGREVADEPREAQEHGLDRDHPHLHDHLPAGRGRCG